MPISQVLKDYLKRNNLKQIDFANKVDVDDSLVSKWLNGKRKIPEHILRFITGKSTRLKKESLTRLQAQSLFGLSPGTKHVWSKKDNIKHNMYLILNHFTYKESLELIINIKEEKNYEEIEEKIILQELIKKEKTLLKKNS